MRKNPRKNTYLMQNLFFNKIFNYFRMSIPIFFTFATIVTVENKKKWRVLYEKD